MPTSVSSATTRSRSLSPPIRPCSARISPTCRSIVWSGFSDVMGSWNTMVMARPRIFRMSASDVRRRSRPPNRMRPPSTSAPETSSRRAIDMAVTDLPEPDSPTSANVPPRFSANDTPSTARVVVPPWVNPTARSVTERSGSVASTSIKPVALRKLAPSSFSYLHERRHPPSPPERSPGFRTSPLCGIDGVLCEL